jgi:hypothetical protein
VRWPEREEDAANHQALPRAETGDRAVEFVLISNAQIISMIGSLQFCVAQLSQIFKVSSQIDTTNNNIIVYITLTGKI